jgi:hypothetical protein
MLLNLAADRSSLRDFCIELLTQGRTLAHFVPILNSFIIGVPAEAHGSAIDDCRKYHGAVKRHVGLHTQDIQLANAGGQSLFFGLHRAADIGQFFQIVGLVDRIGSWSITAKRSR